METTETIIKEAVKIIMDSEETTRIDGSFYLPVMRAAFMMGMHEGQAYVHNIRIMPSELMHRLEFENYHMKDMRQVKRVVMNDMTQQTESMVRMFAVGLEKIVTDLERDCEVRVTFSLVGTFPDKEHDSEVSMHITINSDESISTYIKKPAFKLLMTMVHECGHYICSQIREILLENAENRLAGRKKTPKVKPLPAMRPILH